MPVLVVELLEMIDIDQQERELRAIAPGPGPFLGEALVERAPVDEAGEAVGRCKRGELVLKILLLGHVAHHRDDAVDLAAVRRQGPVQSRLPPVLALVAMTLAIDDPRLLGLAILQRGDSLLDP